MKKLTVLCGMIASGKSTYCRQLVDQGAIIINDDALINMYYNGDYTKYDEKCDEFYKLIQNGIIRCAMSKEMHIVVDKPCLKKNTRERYCRMADFFEYDKECIVFPVCTPIIHAERRFSSNPRGHTYQYWLDCANAHYKLYEEPTKEEGFDNIIFL